MRHGNKVNSLGRKYGHRKALLKNLSINLIEHKRIVYKHSRRQKHCAVILNL